MIHQSYQSQQKLYNSSALDQSFHSQRGGDMGQKSRQAPPVVDMSLHNLLGTASEQRRKSMPVTPNKSQQRTKTKLQDQRDHYKMLNMSINNIPQDNQFFPSLSQTPKEDPMHQKTFQKQPQWSRDNNLNTMRTTSRQRLQQNSRMQRVEGQNDQNQAWKNASSNQYKVRNQNANQVIEQLYQLQEEPITSFVKSKPNDLDSTEGLDSFLDSIFTVVEQNIQSFKEHKKDKVHLSTGVRTEQCQQVLEYICQLQQRGKALKDSAEYFDFKMQQLQKLEQVKVAYEEAIQQQKQQLTAQSVQTFDLEKKVEALSKEKEELAQKENDSNQHSKVLQKKYQIKKEECESLKFRVKHMEDLASMMEPPVSNYQELNQSVEVNRKLEEELERMKESLKKQEELQEQDKQDHFQKIQELFAKVQNESKGLQTTITKQESQIQSKQKVINSLEEKVTATILEKENIIVKLKSEVLMVKQTNEQLEVRLGENQEEQHEEAEKKVRGEFIDRIKHLNQELEQNKKEREDQRKKLMELQESLMHTQNEYNMFKGNRERMEVERENELKGVQEKLDKINEHYERVMRGLQEKVDSYQNENEVLRKGVGIMEMKIRYLGESLDTLLKQKQFISNEIGQSMQGMKSNFDALKHNMITSNNNKDYLISVRKAANQAQSILDMGVDALNKVLQIINFLKIEDLVQMLSENKPRKVAPLSQEPAQDTIEMDDKMKKQAAVEKIHIDPVASLKVHQFMKGKVHLEDQDNLSYLQQMSERSDEYYLLHCPLEMASILLKFIGETLIMTETLSDEMNIPPRLGNLMELANEKTDSFIEREIFMKYLADCKQLIQGKVNENLEHAEKMKSQIEFLEQEVKMITVSRSQEKPLVNVHQESEEELLSGASMGEEESPPKRKYLTAQTNILEGHLTSRSFHKKTYLNSQTSADGMQLFDNSEQRKKEIRRLSQAVKQENGERRSKRSKKKDKNDEEIKQLEIQVERLNVELQDEKVKSKEIQMHLAQKVVVLQENLESSCYQKERELEESEETRKVDIEKLKSGAQLRESTLLFTINEQKGLITMLEKTLEEKQVFLVGEGEKLAALEEERRAFNARIMEKEDELAKYKENVEEFISIKSSNRNTFTLAFEVTENNAPFINEAMLKYYLCKAFGNLDKDKLRLIDSQEMEFPLDYSKPFIQNAQEVVQGAKVIMEIVDDEKNAQEYFSMIKKQIKDGSCILYDIEPLFFGVNLGHFGIHGFNKIKDYHLITKSSRIVQDDEHTVSLLRHKSDPLKFLVISINFLSGKEYVLDLEQEDILELLQYSNTSLARELSRKEPSKEFLELIINNLRVISREGIQILILEHQIFFQNHYQQIGERPALGRFSAVMKPRKSLFENTYSGSQLRDSKILDPSTEKENFPYLSKILEQKESQTDMESSVVYEAFEVVYSGTQKVGKKAEFSIELQEGKVSKSLTLKCEEVHSKEKVQVCFVNNKPVFDQVPSDFVIYSHCMKLKGTHVILLSVEKVVDEGVFMKIHDLKEFTSEEFFLIKKSSGQYSRLTLQQGGGFIIKEDFRNLIYDLTFSYQPQMPSGQVLATNVQYHKELHGMKGDGKEFDLDSHLLVLPKRERNGKVALLKSLEEQKDLRLAAKKVHRSKESAGQLEKGQLLYRNSFMVRCQFDGKEETEQESLISFYINKKEDIAVEVFLFREASKLTIATSVSGVDLFGEEVEHLSFKEKVEMLDLMMEKLFVISENKQCHLKVENLAPPISEVLHQKKSKTTQELFMQQRLSSDLTLLKEMSLKKQDFEERSQVFRRYRPIEGHFYECMVYFVKRGDGESPDSRQSPKKGSRTSRKLNMERQVSNIESFLDENLDFDYLYIEVADKQSLSFSTGMTQKDLTELLLRYQEDILFQSSFERTKEFLVDFILSLLKVDQGSLTLESDRYEKAHFLNTLKNNLGGRFRTKECLGIPPDDANPEILYSKELVSKVLLVNQEVEMCEFTFDIKVFEVGSAQELLCYMVEIQNINDPEVLFQYSYPLGRHLSHLDTPYFISVEVFNLIDHPLKEELRNDSISNDSVAMQRNFQNLFSKYIDNNLMLVVKEKNFPFNMIFSLVEPNSHLQWTYTLRNSDISNSASNTMGKVSFIDQQMVDKYLVLLLNEKSTNQFSLEEVVSEERCEEKLLKVLEVGSLERHPQLLCQHQLEEVAALRLTKDQDRLHLKIEQLQSEIPKPKQHKSKYEQSLEQQNEIVMTLPLRKDSNQFYSTIINIHPEGKKGEVHTSKAFFVILDIQSASLSFKVIDAESPSKVLYQYTLKCTEAGDPFQNNELNLEQVASITQMSSFDHLQQSFLPHQEKPNINNKAFLQSLKNLYSQAQLDLICQSQLELFLLEQRKLPFEGHSLDKLFQLRDTDLKPALQEFQYAEENQFKLKRVMNMIKKHRQEIILHRKTYFDDESEKLIIVSVAIDSQYSNFLSPTDKKKSDQTLEEEVNTFKISVFEPETGKKNEFSLAFEKCFLEEELTHLNKRSIQALKTMAKNLVEERTNIKKLSNEQDAFKINLAEDKQVQDRQGNAYAIEICMPTQDDKLEEEAKFDMKGNEEFSMYAKGVKGRTGSPTILVKEAKNERGSPEEIIELDEEEEDDSAKKGQTAFVQPSVINEEGSQEEDDSNSPFYQQNLVRKKDLLKILSTEQNLNEEEIKETDLRQETLGEIPALNDYDHEPRRVEMDVTNRLGDEILLMTRPLPVDKLLEISSYKDIENYKYIIRKKQQSLVEEEFELNYDDLKEIAMSQQVQDLEDFEKILEAVALHFSQ